MKRSPLSIAALAAAALVLAACGSNDDGGSSGSDATSEEERTYSIGITQIAAHPSLDASREGFKAAFEEGLDEGDRPYVPTEDDPGGASGPHLGDGVPGEQPGAARADRVAERVHEGSRFDEALAVHPVGRRDLLREDRRERSGGVEPLHLHLHPVAANPLEFVEE